MNWHIEMEFCFRESDEMDEFESRAHVQLLPPITQQLA